MQHASDTLKLLVTLQLHKSQHRHSGRLLKSDTTDAFVILMV